MAVSDVDDAVSVVLDRFEELRDGAPGIRGAVLSTDDGHPILSTVPGIDTTSTAAMVAAAIGIGERLATALDGPVLEDVAIRTSDGYVCVFAAGSGTVLTVITDATAELSQIDAFARLHLEHLEAVARKMEQST